MANCVTKKLSDPNSWYHNFNKDNPADLLSRGASAKSILDNSMWFKGPNFLTADEFLFPNEPIHVPEIDTLPETKTKYKQNFENCNNVFLSLSRNSKFLDCILNVTNNYCKLVRILAYILRFSGNCRNGSVNRQLGSLTLNEIHLAEVALIRLLQQSEFPEEIGDLIKESRVSSSSKLKWFSPFLDKDKLIRVGGRLENSSMSYNSKHPIVLPSKNKLTDMIISHYHVKYFHSGPQNLLYQIRQKYWPLNGRNRCRKIVHNCISCFKANPKLCSQKMGDLPKERTNPDFVFNSTGIDLCGPFFIKNKNQRKGSPMKIYVALFICLATKAIH